MAIVAEPASGEAADTWRALYQAERAELERSDRVKRQLGQVLETLQKRNEELSAEAERLRAEARAHPAVRSLEEELEARRRACEAAEEEHCARAREVAEFRSEVCASEALAKARVEATEAAEQAAEALERRRAEADRRREEASARARCMVAADLLHRAEEEADKLHRRLGDQEAEAAKLRQALIDSWAARGDPDAPSEGSASIALQDLDGVERELTWLSRMQQESAAEIHRMQHLERQEATLQKKLRDLSEEKASLQSARVDLGNAGGTLREAIASQSEGWVRRVQDLEQQRRLADMDRAKLLNECADLQVRLDCMGPKLQAIQELEGQHARLRAQRSRLDDESRRLREVNGALGVLLLGEDAPPPIAGVGGDAAALAEALTRVLQLQKRVNERQVSQELERQKLVDRIRELERQASQPDTSLSAKRPAGGGGTGGGAAGGSAGAKTVATSGVAGGVLGAAGAAGAGALASAGSAAAGALRGLGLGAAAW